MEGRDRKDGKMEGRGREGVEREGKGRKRRMVKDPGPQCL
jgi:hypothetical protein